MTTTAKERRQEIGKTISNAMAQLDIDWSRESEAISAAQSELDEVTMKYVENGASKTEVKAVYKRFVNAHRGGLF